MRRIKTIVFPCLVVIIMACLFFYLPSCRKSPQPSYRKVVLYCSVDQEIAEPIIAEFEKQTGIDILPRFDTEASKTVGLVQRIRAEAASPVADVFWSNEIFHTIRLARESLLACYKSETTKDWPEQYADTKGRWYGFALRARVIAYNTTRIAADDAPKCLEDVLDSKWKGRVVMAEPEFGTTGGDVASWFAHYDSDQAKRILEELKANEIRLVAGNSTAVRMVATGQADVCFTDTDDVYAAQRNGWPVEMNYLDQGGDGVLTIPNTAALIRGGGNSKEAGQLMEFLLSEQLEKMLLSSDSHNCPIRESLAEESVRYVIPKHLSLDYEKIADNLSAAIRTAMEVLR
ncbi:MAG: extracellular solute-binding protein [Sedimentisphaerales bacterium]|nr:extracellular solute-binding protein [Sedimentisphaerales bacterium]